MTYLYAIDDGQCKGCGLCIAVCPKKVLELSNTVNAKGYYPAVQKHADKCVFCATCCRMCPDVAITISETEAA